MPAIDPDLCTVIRCAYCGRFALDPPEAPPATDREGWAFLAGQHWPECPWVQTRAWSLSLRPGVPRYPRGVLNMDGPTLRAAGWQLTTEHSASSYAAGSADTTAGTRPPAPGVAHSLGVIRSELANSPGARMASPVA